MDDARFGLAVDADERLLLATFLEFQRDALVRKCDGLTDAQFRARPVATSQLSLAGLVRHLASVENWYFRQLVGGEGDVSPYDYESNEAFGDIAQATHAEAFATWRRETALARQVIANSPLDAVCSNPPMQTQHTTRWILLHMIDEYARHLGHADILREAIDGATGE